MGNRVHAEHKGAKDAERGYEPAGGAGKDRTVEPHLKRQGGHGNPARRHPAHRDRVVREPEPKVEKGAEQGAAAQFGTAEDALKKGGLKVKKKGGEVRERGARVVTSSVSLEGGGSSTPTVPGTSDVAAIQSGARRELTRIAMAEPLHRDKYNIVAANEFQVVLFFGTAGSVLGSVRYRQGEEIKVPEEVSTSGEFVSVVVTVRDGVIEIDPKTLDGLTDAAGSDLPPAVRVLAEAIRGLDHQPLVQTGAGVGVDRQLAEPEGELGVLTSLPDGHVDEMKTTLKGAIKQEDVLGMTTPLRSGLGHALTPNVYVGTIRLDAEGNIVGVSLGLPGSGTLYQKGDTKNGTGVSVVLSQATRTVLDYKPLDDLNQRQAQSMMGLFDADAPNREKILAKNPYLIDTLNSERGWKGRFIADLGNSRYGTAGQPKSLVVVSVGDDAYRLVDNTDPNQPGLVAVVDVTVTTKYNVLVTGFQYEVTSGTLPVEVQGILDWVSGYAVQGK